MSSRSPGPPVEKPRVPDELVEKGAWALRNVDASLVPPKVAARAVLEACLPEALESALTAERERADEFEREAMHPSKLWTWRERAAGLEAERDRLLGALRYIAGFDVAGYDAHLGPEDVARDALIERAALSGKDTPE